MTFKTTGKSCMLS